MANTVLKGYSPEYLELIAKLQQDLRDAGYPEKSVKLNHEIKTPPLIAMGLGPAIWAKSSS